MKPHVRVVRVDDRYGTFWRAELWPSRRDAYIREGKPIRTWAELSRDLALPGLLRQMRVEQLRRFVPRVITSPMGRSWVP